MTSIVTSILFERAPVLTAALSRGLIMLIDPTIAAHRGRAERFLCSGLPVYVEKALSALLQLDNHNIRSEWRRAVAYLWHIGCPPQCSARWHSAWPGARVA